MEPQRRHRRRVVGSLAVLTLLGATMVLASPDADAAQRGSLLCSGYRACSERVYTTNDYPQHAARSYWTMYAGDNCTNYVAYVESTIFGVATPTYNLGDGGQWAQAASRHGVVVNGVPTVGAVAVWTGGSSGIPWPGHVAVVEDVGPRGRYIDISQQHMSDDPDGFDWTRIYRDPRDNEWQDWPNSFVHFHGGPGSLVDGVHVGVAGTPPDALETAGDWRDTFGIRGMHLRAPGLERTTSPSVSDVLHGVEVAYETSKRHLETAGSDGSHRYRVVVDAGTDPSITAVLHGYEVAVQSSTGQLVTVGASGTRVWALRMKAHTSPSITPLLGGGLEIAAVSRAGLLVTLGADGDRRWRVTVRPGTNPSITASFGGGYEVAVETAKGKLATVGTTGTRFWDVMLRSTSSPSITAAFDGGYEVAFVSPAGRLHTVGALGSRIWGLKVRANTSPSITARHGGGYEVAFQSKSGVLVTVDSSRVRVWRIAMAPGTSPSIGH